MNDAKPIPPGRNVYILRCVCGRRIPDSERAVLWAGPIGWPECPECGSRLRRIEQQPVSILARLRYRLALRRWRKARRAQPKKP